MRCRSSAGCPEAAGHGTHARFCAAHAAELAAVRARWFTPEGNARRTPADEAPTTSVEDDARAVAVEVLRDGRAARLEVRERLGWPPARLDPAVTYADGAGWIVAMPSRGLVPGDVIPPGKLPKEVRALMLARYVRTAGRVVPADEAARAVGVSRGGSFPRIVRHAVERGLVRTANGPGGGIAAAQTGEHDY